MPRNASGTYTLPTGNPVVSGDIISSTWANDTMGDLASAITNSLARDGSGGMTAALRVVDGSVSVPGLGFANETGSGLYRSAAGDVGLAILGNQILRMRSTGLDVTGALSYTGTLTGGTGIINIGSGQFYKDASGNVGIGTTSPSQALDIVRSTGSNAYLRTSDGSITALYGASPGAGAGLLGTLSSHPQVFWTNGSERMRIDSSGNVGIGTSSPAFPLDVQANSSAYAINLRGRSSDNISILNFVNNANSVAYGQIDVRSNLMFVNAYANIPMLFGTNNTERMRITADGQLCVGDISAIDVTTTIFGNTGYASLILRHKQSTVGQFWKVGPNAANNFVVWNESGTGVYISTGSTSWTGVSDERLKTDLKPIENAAEKVVSLRAVTGRYKTDREGTSRAFLIAQDVQKVLPEAVNAQNDEMKTLGIAYTDTIPLLVAAFKELKAEVDALKAASA